jgi:hypothetical protein
LRLREVFCAYFRNMLLKACCRTVYEGAMAVHGVGIVW